MKWFVAKVCFQIVTTNGSSAAQFDEQFRLVWAADGTEAYQKALALGKREEETFLNSQGKPVQWKCLGVTELTEVRELQDGTELYSGITETTASADYLQQVSIRRHMLQERFASESELKLTA